MLVGVMALVMGSLCNYYCATHGAHPDFKGALHTVQLAENITQLKVPGMTSIYIINGVWVDLFAGYGAM